MRLGFLSGSYYAGRISRHDHARGHVFGNDASGTDRRALSNGDPAQEGCSRADGGPSLDERLDTFPIGLGLKGAVFIRCSRVQVIREHNSVADKDLILDGYAFANKGMARNLAPAANLGSFLNLDEGPYLGVIPDLAAIEVRESEYTDAFPELNVRLDQLIRVHGNTHGWNDAIEASTSAPRPR
jgi:hypothetical protein